jgi:hypothetical protein
MAIADIKESLNMATNEYAKDIKSYNIQILTIKDDIKKQKDKNLKIEQRLNYIIQEIDYSKRLLQRLNDNFIKKSEMIDEFQLEFLNNIDDKDFEKIYQRKLKDLILLTEEIEEVEQTLLEKELDRLNILSELEPLEDKLDELEDRLKKLELEKEYFETIEVQNISKLRPSSTNNNDVVDIEMD